MKNNLPSAAVRTLADMKRQMQNEQAKRDAVVDKGRRAYHFGIEIYNCPEKELSARKLWEAGWKIAEEKFKILFPSRSQM